MVKDIFVNGNGGVFGAVARLGLPIVLSLVFAGFLLVRLDGALAEAKTTADATHQLMVAAKSEMALAARGRGDSERILRGLLLQVCLNTAKTPDDTRECAVKAQ